MSTTIGLIWHITLLTAVASAPGQAPISGVDPFWKDIVEMGSWGVAILGGLFTAGRAIRESRANREQRDRALREAKEAREQQQRDLRWRQARSGTELVDKLLNEPLAWNALLMLDWDSRDYEVSAQKTFTIAESEVWRALRPYRDICTPKEAYIRDAFDTLFFYMTRLERAIRLDLVTFDDVSTPIGYYVGRMATNHNVYEAYMRAFSHTSALELAQRFDSWQLAES